MGEAKTTLSMRLWLALTLVLLVGFLPVSAVDPAHASYYKSCSQLKKQYRNGVAQSALAVSKLGTKINKPTINAAIYRKNQKLDTNRNGIVCEVVKPTAKPAADPIPALPTSVSFNALHPVATYNIAWGRIAEEVKKAKVESLALRELVGPGVDDSTLRTERARIARTAALWAGIFTPPSNTRLVYVSPTDGEWLANLVPNEGLEDMSPLNNPLRNRVESNDCRFASAGIIRGIYTFIQCLNPRVMGVIERQTGPHEYTHFVQFANGMLPSFAPCWISEGMATFYGVAIGWDGASSAALREKFLKENASSFGSKMGAAGDYEKLASILRSGSAVQIGELFEALSSPSCETGGQPNIQTAYLLGNLAFEALVATHSHAAVENFLADFSREQDWRGSFERNFGLKPEELYRHLAPYIANSVSW